MVARHYYCNFYINIPITNIFFFPFSFQLPASSFYSSKSRTSRRLAARALEEQRTLTQYVIPNNCADSDMEVEDDLEEDYDDDVIDPDYFDIQDEHLTPSTSGKQ